MFLDFSNKFRFDVNVVGIGAKIEMFNLLSDECRCWFVVVFCFPLSDLTSWIDHWQRDGCAIASRTSYSSGAPDFTLFTTWVYVVNCNSVVFVFLCFVFFLLFSFLFLVLSLPFWTFDIRMPIGTSLLPSLLPKT